MSDQPPGEIPTARSIIKIKPIIIHSKGPISISNAMLSPTGKPMGPVGQRIPKKQVQFEEESYTERTRFKKFKSFIGLK